MEDPGARAAGGAGMTRLRRIGVRPLAVMFVVLVLLALTVERGLAWQERHEQAAAAEAASEAATAQVEKLITVSGSTAQDSINSLLDGATGDFRAEFEAQAGRIRRTLADSDVETTGEVVSTGVVRASDTRATVIVAATGTVQNKQAEQPQPRNYRLSVDLEKVGDRWLVSGLEFVA